MKTEKNILIAFILNLLFSIIEFIGGTLTNSVAIISDSIHDIGDSLSIGISYFLEKKSKRKPDNKYTYGYKRYSLLGSIIINIILLIGTIIVIYSSINRLINPVKVNYDGMLIISIIGVVVNFLATYFTRDGDSLNQKSVNLHMLEDVLGWLVVLIGSIIMKFTDISIIDPILSILVALFILIHVFKNLKMIINLFLEKTPSNIDVSKLKDKLLTINEVKDVHHVHIWSLDGYNHYATVHVVVDDINDKIKKIIKDELKEMKINHSTIELENLNEKCDEIVCKLDGNSHHHGHHH